MSRVLGLVSRIIVDEAVEPLDASCPDAMSEGLMVGVRGGDIRLGLSITAPFI